jgi:hypothetical protein
VIDDKRVEYTLFLKKQLSKNADRIETEKVSITKFNTSISQLQDKFKEELEAQLDIIKQKETNEKK